jgi:phosphopantetheinyl transferase
MALDYFATSKDRAWALWKIDEDEMHLSMMEPLAEQVPETITHPNKRSEWIVARLLTAKLLKSLGCDYYGIEKDVFGKPFPRRYPFHLSLSHSYPYVAAVLDQREPVGIDLEQPKQKLLRVAPRVLHPFELTDAGQDVVKHCVYWCAKEAMVKIYGKKDLVFAENLQVDSFELHNEGDIVGKIIVGDNERLIPLYYRVYPNFVVVLNKPAKR